MSNLPAKKVGLLLTLLWSLESSGALGLPLTQWERLEPNEEQVANASGDDLIKLVMGSESGGKYRAFRDAHPRGIGCVAARFTVESSLIPELQTGVFDQPGKTYDAIIRFSSSLGPVGDNVGDARGMAIKLFAVPGRKLLDDQPDAVTHDFLQIDGPTFPAANTEDFAGIVRVKMNPLTIANFLSKRTFIRTKALANVVKSTVLNPNNGKSLIDRAYFSMVPYLLKGAKINSPIKFSSRPCGPVQGRKLDGSAGELRNDLQTRLNEADICFQFGVQLYRDGVGFDVEDGSNLWPENVSPFIKVATIIIPRQNFMTDQKLAYCDALSFQPWHAIEQHRPLGNINRARKIIYEKISKYRHNKNREISLYLEPTGLQAWNSLTSPTYSVWNSVLIPAPGGSSGGGFP